MADDPIRPIMSKTAVVTGGSSGIGRSTVERLLSEGWTVWNLDLNAESAADAARRQQDGRRYRFEQCDVSQAASVKNAFEQVGAEHSTLDALICSAGAVRVGSLEEHTPEQVDLILGVNVKGPWLCVREALPLLRKDASTINPSRVVILGSVAGIRPKVGAGFYGASKAALHVLTGVLAVELAPSGVIVNAVAPASVETPMMQSVAGGSYKISNDSPLGRIAQPEDVTDVIMFYLGDAAKYVNGTVLPVDGGTRAAFVKR
ncbi:hypothetical protein C7T35_21360 [Variovorax sp. WS11]|uniref:SDR family NAD(P)-dependent oxidoreductase n=1 Tax=Variovorax sp. WS11 TaxID=1105204 RepID=UPI000D0CC2EE|nr:SDR family oxidoreductase [Variovorax sp. WS11]NDZ18780.1 SDR family oxidoreductase [Variovorax sp. WS11]PSL82556.1 hypothetical protein C7T35_21360 [Variovorax sp. WS11]